MPKEAQEKQERKNKEMTRTIQSPDMLHRQICSIAGCASLIAGYVPLPGCARSTAVLHLQSTGVPISGCDPLPRVLHSRVYSVNRPSSHKVESHKYITSCYCAIESNPLPSNSHPVLIQEQYYHYYQHHQHPQTHSQKRRPEAAT